MMKTMIAASLMFAATVSFAAPTVQTVTVANAETEALRVWSSVCVGNLELDASVNAQYMWHNAVDGGGSVAPEWKDIEIKKNTIIRFMQRFPTDVTPYVLTIKFAATDADDSVELTYDLDQTVTRLQPRSCNSLENYGFAETDAGSIDLIHAAH